MAKLLLVALLLRATCGIKMEWVRTLPPKVALNSHTVCNNATGYCRAMAHFVFTAAPKDITHPLIGSAKFSLDSGKTWSFGTPARFESHLVNGICPNFTDSSSCTSMEPAQMWDWNYDATFPIADLGSASKEVCAAPFVTNPYTDEKGSLESVCLPLQPVEYINVPRVIGAFQPKFIYANLSEAADHYCSDEYCRTVVHSVVLASVPDPTDTVEVVAQYSFDKGPWRTDSVSSFFENKMSVKTGGVWFQTYQWDFDRVVKGKEEPPKEVCFKLNLANRVSMESVPFNFTKFGHPEDAFTTRCLKFCSQHLSPFHNPRGYCDKQVLV